MTKTTDLLFIGIGGHVLALDPTTGGEVWRRKLAAHRFPMESASFDHDWVEVRVAGSGSVGRKLDEWTGATMTTTVGAASIDESAGWAAYSVDISEYAGRTIELRFNVDSDTSVNLAGPAIDDVAVSAGGALPVNLMSFEAE